MASPDQGSHQRELDVRRRVLLDGPEPVARLFGTEHHTVTLVATATNGATDRATRTVTVGG